MSTPTFSKGELEVLKLWKRLMKRLQKPHNTNHVRIEKGSAGEWVLYVHSDCKDKYRFARQYRLSLVLLRLVYKSDEYPWGTFASRVGEQKALKMMLKLARARCCTPESVR